MVQYVVLGFVIAMLAVELRPSPNHYDTLGLSNQAQRPDIHAAYNRAKYEYENDEATTITEALFEEMTKAHTVLMSKAQRTAYQRFGDLKDVSEESDFLFCIATSVIAAMLSFCVGFFCTLSRQFQSARQWLLIYLVAIVIADVYIRFVDHETLASLPILGSMLPFERVLALRGIFPAILCFAIYAADFLFVDQLAYTHALLRETLKTNNDIM